jgi:alginate O-acetyltransferase complex protein AlgJ
VCTREDVALRNRSRHKSIPVAAVAVLASTMWHAGCGGPDIDDLIGPFRTELGRLASDAETAERIGVAGLDGWLFFSPELRHVSVGRFWGPEATVVSRSRRAEDADPLPAIQDFKRQLDDLGVELLLVPVPPKAVVYPEKISHAITTPIPIPRFDLAHERFYERLRADGIDVLDLTDLFIAERFHPDGPIYCRTDTHWSGTGCTIAAAAIAGTIRGKGWYHDLDTQPYAAAWYSTTITGDLTHEDGVPGLQEELRLRGVVSGTGRDRSPLSPDPTSPIVLLGDSHNLVFHAGSDMHATGAGLPDQLAFELGLPIDLVAVRGSGATAARVNLLRRAQADPEYWSRKQLVIWCFAARELTESDGWRLVPVAP